MSVSFNEIPSGVRVPLFYAEMDNSKANTTQANGASLLIGSALPGAKIDRNKLVIMPSADFAKKMCGQGSQLARQVEAYRKTDPFGELYVIAVEDSVGATASVASVEFSGTPTETGSVSVYIGAKRSQAVIALGDKPLDIAQSLSDVINKDPDSPVMAVASAGPRTVNVNDITFLTPPPTEAAIGQPFQMTAQAQPANATNPALEWSSSNEQVLEVSTKIGTTVAITGKKAGKATITVKSTQNPSIQKTFEVEATVDGPVVTSIAGSLSSYKVGIGEDLQLDVKLAPLGAKQDITYTIDDATKATVSSAGMVHGLVLGPAIITAKSTATPAITTTINIEVVAANTATNPGMGGTTGSAVTPPTIVAPTGDMAHILLTSKVPGEAFNGFPIALNYFGAVGGEDIPDGVTVRIEEFTGGAGIPDLTNAIGAMGDEAFDFIGFPFNDSNSLGLMREEMNDISGRWSWIRQLYGHVYSAVRGTLSELVALGDAVNDQHLTLCGYEPETQSPLDELIAARLGREAGFIRNDPARPTQTGEIVGGLPAPLGSRFTVTERQSLLSHGIATSFVNVGAMLIERSITTYKVNKFGVTDNSYLDSETLHTSAYVLRNLKAAITSKYPRHKLANDGTRFGEGQAVVTPAVLKGEICAGYRAMERAGIVENFEAFKKNLIVERNASDPTRVDVLYPSDYVNQLRVFALLNQFRLQYSQEELA